MLTRDEELSKGWVQIEHPLLIETTGGKIAGNARKNLEKETKRKVITSQNYLSKKLI